MPTQMIDRVYEGMVVDLHDRKKSIVTEDDDQSMKCRWVRQLIHAELDSIREEHAARGEDLPVEFEVEGALADRSLGGQLIRIELANCSFLDYMLNYTHFERIRPLRLGSDPLARFPAAVRCRVGSVRFSSAVRFFSSALTGSVG